MDTLLQLVSAGVAFWLALSAVVAVVALVFFVSTWRRMSRQSREFDRRWDERHDRWRL